MSVSKPQDFHGARGQATDVKVMHNEHEDVEKTHTAHLPQGMTGASHLFQGMKAPFTLSTSLLTDAQRTKTAVFLQGFCCHALRMIRMILW